METITSFYYSYPAFFFLSCWFLLGLISSISIYVWYLIDAKGKDPDYRKFTSDDYWVLFLTIILGLFSFIVLIFFVFKIISLKK